MVFTFNLSLSFNFIQFSGYDFKKDIVNQTFLVYNINIVGANGGEGPPVPIPNTEVKLISAENTWLEAARENRAAPTQEKRKMYLPHG